MNGYWLTLGIIVSIVLATTVETYLTYLDRKSSRVTQGPPGARGMDGKDGTCKCKSVDIVV